MLFVVAAQTELQTAAVPLQWRAAECRISKHAGPPPQWWEMCHGILVFNVRRQAWAMHDVYTVKPES